MKLEHGTPMDIERESMRIIAEELGARGLTLPPDRAEAVRRAIHATADFDYAENLRFTPGVMEAGIDALRAGMPIVTDTNMALAGISAEACKKLGVERLCLMADARTRQLARGGNTTRAAAAVDLWAEQYPEAVCVVGNAPTALLRMAELMEAGTLRPALVIGVPVGFVNVVESKEQMWSLCQRKKIPGIVAMGRKGGSTVAAALCNALLYQAAGLR